MFTAALFTIAKCPSTDEWIKNMLYIYTIEYYSAVKTEWQSAILSNVDGPRERYAQCNQVRQRKTNTVWNHLYVESKKKIQMNV